MTAKDPYKDSPYDASGMPLGAETVDYDKKDDVAKATVKDKPVEFPKSINDIDYEPAPIDPKLLKKIDPKKFNTAIKDNVNSAHPLIEAIDFEDPDEKRKLIVKEAESKDIGVAELPKTEKKETVDEIKKDIKKDEEDTSFLDDKEEKGKK